MLHNWMAKVLSAGGQNHRARALAADNTPSIGSPADLPATATFRRMMRGGLAMLVATGVTIGLFAFMRWAVTVEYERPAAPPRYVLETLTPSEIDEPVMRDKRPKPVPVDAAMPPPPLPKYTAPTGRGDFPDVIFTGTSPADIPVPGIGPGSVTPIALPDRIARPLYPPQPVYPSAAIARNLEGACEVRLDVDPRGRPFNVTAVCTDPVFARSAENAVSKVMFAPKILNGRALERRNVIYPLEFRLDN